MHDKIFPVFENSAMIFRFLFLTIATLVFFSNDPAKADLVVCNDTESRIGVSIGYKDQSGWGSEGWWNIQPEKCQPILAGELESQYYYLHAIDYDLGGEWSGGHQMCVTAESFTIRGNITCTKQGWETAGFLRIDTEGKTNWVIRLDTDEKTNNGQTE